MNTDDTQQRAREQRRPQMTPVSQTISLNPTPLTVIDEVSALRVKA